MNAIRLVLAFLLATSVGAAQRLDTLRYNAGRGGYVYYRDPAITMQAARFELAAPARIQSITLTLGGSSSDGSVTVHIYGHEGGLPAPGIERDLIRPIVVRKSKAGVEHRTIAITARPQIRSHQFFVAVDHISSGVTLLSDRLAKHPTCVSGDDNFTYQALRDTRNRWSWGKYAYAIAAVVEYDRVPDDHAALRDVTRELHLADSTNTARSIAWADVDGDAYLDLLVGGRLYRNEHGTAFRDVTRDAGLPDSAAAGVFIDANNDGAVDILVIGEVAHGEIANVLYLNNRDRGFTRHPVSIAALERPMSISIADADGDGYLDLFLGQGANAGSATPGYHLYLNNRSGDFVDATELLPAAEGARLACRGSQWADVDGDGDLDLFVAGDGAAGDGSAGSSSGGDRLWLRDAGGHFVPAAAGDLATIATTARRAGCHWFDYDNDGRLDLLLPTRQTVSSARTAQRAPKAVIRRVSDARFDVADNDDVQYEEQRAGGAWGDINNDGLADFILTTSCDCRYAGLYEQGQGGSFTDRTYEYGLSRLAAGDDAMWVDYDNDGRLDLATFAGGRILLLKNERPSANNYVEFDLAGTHAVGATVEVWARGEHYTQEVTSGRGLLMQEPSRLHFGVGGAHYIDSAVVHWSNGRTEAYRDLGVDALHTLREGASSNSISGGVSDVRAAPNPFSTYVTISYSLPVPQNVRIAMYTVQGGLVRTLTSERQDAGEHTVTWKGDNEDGEKASQGTYVYRITAGGREASGAVVFVR